MPTLTLIAQVTTTPEQLALVQDAMLSATKVFNGLLWHLRDQYDRTGHSTISRKALNALLKTLPRAKSYFCCGVVAACNRVHRGWYRCSKCGFAAQSDLNGAANIHSRAFDVAPWWGSGAVAAPVVMRLGPQKVHAVPLRRHLDRTA